MKNTFIGDLKFVKNSPTLKLYFTGKHNGYNHAGEIIELRRYDAYKFMGLLRHRNW